MLLLLLLILLLLLVLLLETLLLLLLLLPPLLFHPLFFRSALLLLQRVSIAVLLPVILLLLLLLWLLWLLLPFLLFLLLILLLLLRVRTSYFPSSGERSLIYIPRMSIQNLPPRVSCKTEVEACVPSASFLLPPHTTDLLSLPLSNRQQLAFPQTSPRPRPPLPPQYSQNSVLYRLR